MVLNVVRSYELRQARACTTWRRSTPTASQDQHRRLALLRPHPRHEDRRVHRRLQQAAAPTASSSPADHHRRTQGADLHPPPSCKDNGDDNGGENGSDVSYFGGGLPYGRGNLPRRDGERCRRKLAADAVRQLQANSAVWQARNEQYTPIVDAPLGDDSSLTRNLTSTNDMPEDHQGSRRSPAVTTTSPSSSPRPQRTNLSKTS